MDVWIVILPLVGALVAGLGNRRLGDRGAQWITSGLLLVSMVMSWIVFLGMNLGGGTPRDTVICSRAARCPATCRADPWGPR